MFICNQKTRNIDIMLFMSVNRWLTSGLILLHFYKPLRIEEKSQWWIMAAHRSVVSTTWKQNVPFLSFSPHNCRACVSDLFANMSRFRRDDCWMSHIIAHCKKTHFTAVKCSPCFASFFLNYESRRSGRAAPYRENIWEKYGHQLERSWQLIKYWTYCIKYR